MKTRLLKRLRRNANTALYIEVYSSVKNGVRYYIVHDTPIGDEIIDSYDDCGDAINGLNSARRKHILNEIEMIKWKRHY